MEALATMLFEAIAMVKKKSVSKEYDIGIIKCNWSFHGQIFKQDDGY